jgi:hypothetical protein
MNFVSADPSIVRSIRQRGMLNLWLRLYARINQPPKFEDFKLNGLPRELDDLVFYLVDSCGNEISFLVESDGRRAYQAYGKSGKGRYLHEYLPPAIRDQVLPIYAECVRRRLPVFTVSRVNDITGTEVEFERLLLPFTGVSGIERVIAALSTISIDGGFEIRHLMKRSESLPIYDVLSVIDQRLFYQTVGQKEVVEIDE